MKKGKRKSTFKFWQYYRVKPWLSHYFQSFYPRNNNKKKIFFLWKILPQLWSCFSLKADIANDKCSSKFCRKAVGSHLQHSAYLNFRSHADCHQPKNQVLPTKSDFLIHGKIEGVCRKQLAVDSSVSAQLHQVINSEKLIWSLLRLKLTVLGTPDLLLLLSFGRIKLSCHRGWWTPRLQVLFR